MKISREYTFAGLLLTPWIATFVVFWLYPLLYVLYLSLTQYSTIAGTAEFIGIDNYLAIIHDEIFWKSLQNTTIFTVVTVPATTVFALFLAALINRRATKFKGFFRSAFFLPSATSLVVLALIFTNLYSRRGYVNLLLESCGIPYPDKGWLLDVGAALPAIMAMDVWIATGYYVVLLLAAMQTISQDLYESAELSGATAWQQFRLITLPLLRPTILFIIVVNTIKSFQIFVEIYVMTKGGPLSATTTLVYLIYEYAFEKQDTMGYASALAFVLFLTLLAVSALQMRLLRSKQ